LNSPSIGLNFCNDFFGLNRMTDSQEDETVERPERSAIAEEVRALELAISRSVSKRERMPQPTFWFLFHKRIEEIKKKRELQRKVDEILGGS
jgi:hypothetical protein